MNALVARAAELGAEAVRVRRELRDLIADLDREGDRERMVARLLWVRWMVRTGRMTDYDNDDDRAYPTMLHSPWVWWAGVACGLFWVVLVVWLIGGV